MCTNRLNRVLVVSAFALVVLAVTTSAWARPRFRAVLVLDNGVDFSYGNASPGAWPQINDHNQIVFLNAFIDGKFTARYWENGKLYRLGNDTGYTWLSAHAINNQSEFAGDLIYTTDTGDVLIQHPHPFRTFNKVVTELPLDPGAHQFDSACYNSRATDLNDLGVAAGWVKRPITRGYQLDYAVVWNSGGITDIGPLNPHPPDSQFAHAPYVVINNSGTVAGMYFVNYSGCQSCYLGWYGTPGAITQVSPFPGGKAVALWDINNLGVLAGNSDLMIGPTYVANHAMLVSGGTKQDIHGTVYPATTQSRAYAVNDSGAAVGSFQNFRGFYHDNDTTWLMDSLLVNNASFPDLYEAFDINNEGYVVALCGWPSGTPRVCLLVPVDSLWYVNTTNDLPDLNPNDGRCFTGNITPFGEDECSFRAAIQHTNAYQGPDTIRFKIPVTGVPQILVSASLPHVNEQVFIDAETQPGAHRVEVMRADSVLIGDGLVITADSCTLRGLLLNRFEGSGLVLDDADYTRVEKCHFGVRPDSVTAAGNGSAGVFVQDASGCEFGTGGLLEPNFIAHNGGPGLLIVSGSENKVSNNHFFENGGLGIDLFPVGVTRNDPGDSDAGANGLVNYPYIDSVVVSSGQSRVYGEVTAGTSTLYTVRLYKSDSCDASGYGEGRTPVGSALVFTPTLERDAFEILWADTLKPGEVLTLTATALSGSTSEFSPCWPGEKRLVIEDGHGSPIANRIFALSKVDYDPPTYTETFLDSVTTDAQGEVDLTEHYEQGSLKRGDSVKVGRILERFTRAKGPVQELFNGRIVELDNGKFDSLSHDRTYDELDAEPRQVVRLDHSTHRLNLLVSVEWEADSAYLERLGEGFRNLSNYYYDVFDGQVRLDTVVILNHHLSFTSADITVYADNSLRPHSRVDGYQIGGVDPRVKMGRRWFGTNIEPDLSIQEWPLRPDDPMHFRTIGHEMGHYVHFFFDEYNFTPKGARCLAVPNYGLMDKQSDGSAMANELSWDPQYTSGFCRNTDQWRGWAKSCWDVLQFKQQKSFDGIYAEIITPAERNLPPAADFFFGPNAPGQPLQVDVGALTQVRIFFSSPRQSTDLRIRVGSGFGSLAGAQVTTKDQFLWAEMFQGLTDRNGDIRLLGVRPGDSVFVNGRPQGTIPPPRAFAAADSQEVWYSASLALPTWTGDTLTVTPTAVAGYLPVLVNLDLAATTATLRMDYLSAFGGVPDLLYHSDTDTALGPGTTLSMSDIAGSYQATLDLADASVDVPVVYALDDSSQSFQFSTWLALGGVDSAAVFTKLHTADGTVAVEVDSSSSATRVGVAATNYLVMRDGINPEARRAGKSASVSCYPAPAWSDSTVLTLSYDDIELEGATPPFDLEASIAIFRWNSGVGEWELLGGAVDTALNEVSAHLPEAGLYAAFSTGVVTEVGEEPQGLVIPESYELAQNHPNPFNPSTSISYYLPRPGHVNVRIHNILGQTVRVLVDDVRTAGAHEVVWDGRTTSGDPAGSGVYFYSLRAGDVVLTRKMVLMK